MPSNNLPVYQPQHQKNRFIGNKRPLLLIAHLCIAHATNTQQTRVNLAIVNFCQ